MGDEATPKVRPMRRGDVPRVADLRFKYLSETARLEPRLRLLVEAKEHIHHAVAGWPGAEDRVAFVAEGAASGTGGDLEPPLLGYAAGLSSVWPPIFKTQHVGEIYECFVTPPSRGSGVGRALLSELEAELRRRGAEVFRARVPQKNDGSLALFRARGFDPVLVIMERTGSGG